VKILIVAPSDDGRRFKRDLPPVGSQFLRRPNYEILRLAGLIVFPDESVYVDERVEEVDLENRSDLVLLYADLGFESRVSELAGAYQRRGQRVIVFGPLATIISETLSPKVDSVVVGDISNIWPEIRIDFLTGRLKKIYPADRTPRYTLPAWEKGRTIGFDNRFQAIQAVLGCFCPEPLKPICPQFLYYGDKTHIRPLPEVIGEIVALPAKQVFLLDDDVSRNPDYYNRLFSQVWSFRKKWFVQAGPAIFNSPALLRLLPKAGIHSIFLNEDWFTGDEVYEACKNRAVFLKKHRQIQLLHSLKMLVGARILLIHREEPVDFRTISGFLSRLGIDILELKVFAPVSKTLKSGSVGDRFTIHGIMLWPEIFSPSQFPSGFVWLKDQFYSLNSIFGRALRALPKIGIYNTFQFFFMTNLAYRQNYLEGISYPP